MDTRKGLHVSAVFAARAVPMGNTFRLQPPLAVPLTQTATLKARQVVLVVARSIPSLLAVP